MDSSGQLWDLTAVSCDNADGSSRSIEDKFY